MAEVYPDRSGKVRNVGVRLKPRQSGTADYVSTSSIVVKRHVSNLIVLVPAEERDGKLSLSCSSDAIDVHRILDN